MSLDLHIHFHSFYCICFDYHPPTKHDPRYIYGCSYTDLDVQWLRSAPPDGPNWVPPHPLSWGRTRMQFLKFCVIWQTGKLEKSRHRTYRVILTVIHHCQNPLKLLLYSKKISHFSKLYYHVHFCGSPFRFYYHCSNSIYFQVSHIAMTDSKKL
jgi:hypothetical protein